MAQARGTKFRICNLDRSISQNFSWNPQAYPKSSSYLVMAVLAVILGLTVLLATGVYTRDFPR